MLEQKVAEFFKGGKAQNYTPKFGLKRPDPVETGIKKLKAANVKPVPKGEMHVTAGLLGSEAFIAGFVDELAALEKEAGITGKGAATIAALAATLGATAVPTVSHAAPHVYRSVRGAAGKVFGFKDPAMPKLPGQAEADTAHAESTVAKMNAKLKQKQAAQKEHDSTQKAPSFPGANIIARNKAVR